MTQTNKTKVMLIFPPFSQPKVSKKRCLVPLGLAYIGAYLEEKIVRERLSEYKDNFFKSTGILKIAPEFGKKFVKWLDEGIKQGKINLYLDLIIAEHLSESPIYICDITGCKWADVDDLDDLRRAGKLLVSD